MAIFKNANREQRMVSPIAYGKKLYLEIHKDQSWIHFFLTLSWRAKIFENIKNGSTFWILFHNFFITYANIWNVCIFEITIKRSFICNYSYLVIVMYDVIDHETFKVFFTIFFHWMSQFFNKLCTVNKIFVIYFINKIIPIGKLILIVYLFPIHNLEAGNSG